MKSPDSPIFARRTPPSPDKRSLEQKYKSNEISETKPMKLYSSLMMNEMIRDDTSLPASRKQSHSSLNNIYSSTIESSDISSESNSEIVRSESNSDQQKKVSHSKLDNY